MSIGILFLLENLFVRKNEKGYRAQFENEKGYSIKFLGIWVESYENLIYNTSLALKKYWKVRLCSLAFLIAPKGILNSRVFCFIILKLNSSLIFSLNFWNREEKIESILRGWKYIIFIKWKRTYFQCNFSEKIK